MKSKFTHSKLFTILAAIILSLIIIPLTVQAAGGTMTDSGVSGSGSIIGGPSYQRTGWLFYVTTPEGEMQSDVKAITSFSGGIVDRNGNYLPTENIHLESRFGVTASSLLATNCEWGSPFDITGKGRGREVKDIMLKTSESTGQKVAYNLINKAWSQDLAIKWNQREVLLVFEPIYWNMVYEGGSPTGIWQCGTSNFFGKYQQQYGINAPDYNGDSKIRKYTNNLYSNCVKFDTQASIGITPPTHGGLCTNEELANPTLGYGIGVVWNDTNAIHSYSQSNGSPGAPQSSSPPLNGTSNIIKCYYEENITTGIKTDLGTYKTLECTNNIYIEDEPNFEIEEWVISSSTNPSITSLAFNPPSTILRQGITSQEVTLGGIEKTVYILLKRVEEDPPTQLDYNYNLSQSSITRRVRLSNPDNQLTLPKVQNHIFTWTSSAHQTECTTHNCGGCYCDGHSHRSSCSDSCTSSHRCSGCKCSGHRCTNWQWKSQTLKFSHSDTNRCLFF